MRQDTVLQVAAPAMPVTLQILVLHFTTQIVSNLCKTMGLGFHTQVNKSSLLYSAK